jgi:hypothetical protein
MPSPSDPATPPAKGSLAATIAAARPNPRRRLIIIAASLAIGNSPEFAQFAEKHGLILDVKGPKQMDEEMDEYTRIFRELIVFMDQKK